MRSTDPTSGFLQQKRGRDLSLSQDFVPKGPGGGCVRHYHVLVGGVVGRFPLDDSEGLGRVHGVQVPRGQPVVRDHLHHHVVRGGPLVRRHHPHLPGRHGGQGWLLEELWGRGRGERRKGTHQEQVLLVSLHLHRDVVGAGGAVVGAPVQLQEGRGIEDAIDLGRESTGGVVQVWHSPEHPLAVTF